MYYIRYEVDWKYQIKHWFMSGVYAAIVVVSAFVMGMGVMAWLLQ